MSHAGRFVVVASPRGAQVSLGRHYARRQRRIGGPPRFGRRRLGEAATSAQSSSGGHGSLGNDGDDDALASMIMPLGLSALQVQSSAVKAWRRAVASPSSTPDARIGLANSLVHALLPTR